MRSLLQNTKIMSVNRETDTGPIPDRVFQSCHAIYFCQYDYCADEVPRCGFFIKKYGLNWMRIGVSWMRIGISWLRIGASWMRIGVSWRRKIAKIRIPVRSQWAYVKTLNWPNMATKNVFQNRLILKKKSRVMSTWPFKKRKFQNLLIWKQMHMITHDSKI